MDDFEVICLSKDELSNQEDIFERIYIKRGKNYPKQNLPTDEYWHRLDGPAGVLYDSRLAKVTWVWWIENENMFFHQYIERLKEIGIEEHKIAEIILKYKGSEYDDSTDE